MSAHKFEKVHFSKLTWCFYCKSFIYGMGKQGVKCTKCGYISHHRCSELVPKECGKHRTSMIEKVSAPSKFFFFHSVRVLKEASKRVLTRMETKQNLLEMPKTEVENSLEFTSSSVYDDKEEEKIIEKTDNPDVALNILVGILQPQVQTGSWEPIDGGYSRMVVYVSKHSNSCRYDKKRKCDNKFFF